MTESNGTVSGITSSPPQANQGAPAQSTAVADPFASLNATLDNVTKAINGAENAKDKTSGAVAGLEKLFGIGQDPATPAPSQGPSILTVLLVGALVILGGVVVWKLARRA